MNQEILKIEQEQKGIEEQVNLLIIANQETYERAASIKISLSTFRKKLNLFFDPMVSTAKLAYDEVRGTRDKYLNPTKELEKTILVKLKKYQAEMERKAEEEKRIAEEEKQKKINEENKKLKQEAEVFGETAEEVNPDDIEVKETLPTINKVTGLGIRKTWKWKVVDESKIPKKYFILDEMRINREVRGLKEQTKIEGIEVYCE